MIQVQHVSKSFWQSFKTIKVLHDISFEIQEGEVFGFLGPNGAGKTTTIKLLLGLLWPDQGSVRINNKNPADLEIKKITGYLPENPYFYQYLNGEEFLYFCGELCGLTSEQIKKNTKRLLLSVNMWEERKKLIRYYSKGMMQRIGIAQSLIHDPQILFLDEPLSGLDPIGRREIKNIILELKKQKKTMLINTHILNDVEELCDTVAIIDKGKILKQGAIQTLTKGKSLEDFFVKTIKNKRT